MAGKRNKKNARRAAAAHRRAGGTGARTRSKLWRKAGAGLKVSKRYI